MALSDDKRNGAILGHALGDALGAPCEFYPFALYTGVLNTSIVRYSRAYGRQVCPIGQITDDTEMALVLMQTLNSGYTKEKAVVNYMLWANNNYEGCKGNMPFMGKNTRNLFIAPKPTYKLYNNRFNKHYPDEITKENSQSNGALMRAYPLAFVDDLDPEIIRTDVGITNPSELVQTAVFAYITAIKMALNGNSKEEIKEYSILYIMFNYPNIISPRVELFEDIQFSSTQLNRLKAELLVIISEDKFNQKNLEDLAKTYSDLIKDINQNAVIKNIFQKKDEEKQIELLNEILKELNDIKFSKKIENLENKLIEKFDEKSYSDLIKLKSKINKE